MVPDQAPEALQEVPVGADQVRVEPPPFATVAGVALRPSAAPEL
jgi:hypothetical protein